MLRALRDNPRVPAVVFAALLLLPALLAERLSIPLTYVMPDGDRVGILLRALYLIPVFTGAASVLLWPQVFASVLRRRYAAIGLALVAADLGVYLLAGALEGSAKATLALSIAPAASVGALLTGVAIFRAAPAALDWLIAAATTLSAVVGGFQLAEFFELSTPLGRAIMDWDLATAEAFGTTVAWRRAEGFAMNPNMYTPLAIVGFIWAIFGGRSGAVRWVTLVASSAIAVFGQSRTTLIVLVLLLLLALVRGALTGSRRVSPARVAAVSAGVALVTAVLGAGVLVGRASGTLPERVVAATVSVRTLFADPMGDESVSSRAGAWSASAEAIGKWLWGHFERSRFILKPLSHPHNEFLYRVLYAGPLWLLVHLAFLVWLWRELDPQDMRWIGIAIATSLMVNGITELLNRMHPFTVLLYLVIGAALWRMDQDEAGLRLNSR